MRVFDPLATELVVSILRLDAGLIVGRDNRLTIERDGKRVTLTPGSGYLPLAAPINNSPDSPSAAFDKLPVVFAGVRSRGSVGGIRRLRED